MSKYNPIRRNSVVTENKTVLSLDIDPLMFGEPLPNQPSLFKQLKTILLNPRILCFLILIIISVIFILLISIYKQEIILLLKLFSNYLTELPFYQSSLLFICLITIINFPPMVKYLTIVKM